VQPFSHSLFSALLIGFLLAAGTWRSGLGRAATVAVFVAVVGHWVLDFLIHDGDLTIWPSISRSSALLRGFLNLTRIHSPSGEVLAIGSQLETATLDSNVLAHTLYANTDWTITVPGQGDLFLSQREGGPDLGELQAIAEKTHQAWKGHRAINHTVGPIPGTAAPPIPVPRGIVHGGTGEFATLSVFSKSGTSSMRSPSKATCWHGLSTRSYCSTCRVPFRTRKGVRTESASSAGSWPILWRTASMRRTGLGAGSVFPPALGVLTDPALRNVTVMMVKLRDERGEVVGQAAASTTLGGSGAPRAQWTLTLPGEGTIYVVPDSRGDSWAEGQVLGGRGGTVIDGTGRYANATGVVLEEMSGPSTWTLPVLITIEE
jgi:hypothetical protein